MYFNIITMLERDEFLDAKRFILLIIGHL